jgi:hypothetical protein
MALVLLAAAAVVPLAAAAASAGRLGLQAAGHPAADLPLLLQLASLHSAVAVGQAPKGGHVQCRAALHLLLLLLLMMVLQLLHQVKPQQQQQQEQQQQEPQGSGRLGGAAV